jgi:hypothetical protein
MLAQPPFSLALMRTPGPVRCYLTLRKGIIARVVRLTTGKAWAAVRRADRTSGPD